MDYIKAAGRFMQKGIDKLEAEDKRIIGKALMVGKESTKSKLAFNKWLKANGLDAVPANARTELLWLADDDHWAFYQGESGWGSVREARKAWNSTHGEASVNQLVLQVLSKTPKTTAMIADEAGIDLHRSSQALRTLKKSGMAVSGEKRGEYRLPTKAERKASKTETKPSRKPAGVKSVSTYLLEAKNAMMGLHQHHISGKERWQTLVPAVGDPFRHGEMTDNMFMSKPAENWAAAIERPATDEEAASEHQIAGWAKATMWRVVAQDVWVPVNSSGESLEGLAINRDN